MPNSLKIGIADITISLEADRREDIPAVPPAYLPFICSGKTDIRLRLHRRKPHLPTGEKIFSSSPIWHLFRHQDLSILKVFEELDVPGSTMVFSDHLQTVDLYPSDRSGRRPDPFEGPILELLMIHYLALEKGVVIHACGVEKEGLGLLFAGESGAGKSTLTILWDQVAGVEILSDDRTIVRKKDGDYWIYGTPWHGEAKFGSPQSVKLDRIFFIQHGAENSARIIKGALPVQHLLTCSFPPYWDSEGMEFTMDLFSDLTGTAPCYELFFIPNGDIVDFVRGNLAE